MRLLRPVAPLAIIAAMVCGSIAVFAEISEKPPACAADPAISAARLIESCSVVIAAELTPVPARTTALLLRAAAFEQIYQTGRMVAELDRAIADYDAAIKLDPRDATVYARRAMAWRGKGNRPRALADYDAALRIDPQLADAAEQRRLLVQEIERIGATMPVRSKQGDCASGPDCPR